MNEYKINHVNKKKPRFLSVLLEFCLGTNWQYKFSKLEQYTVHLWCLLFIEKKEKDLGSRNNHNLRLPSDEELTLLCYATSLNNI